MRSQIDQDERRHHQHQEQAADARTPPPPMNFWPYSSARRLSPSVDLSRSVSHCLIDRSHLPPPARVDDVLGVRRRDHVPAVLERLHLEAHRVEIDAVAPVRQRLDDDRARRLRLRRRAP